MSMDIPKKLKENSEFTETFQTLLQSSHFELWFRFNRSRHDDGYPPSWFTLDKFPETEEDLKKEFDSHVDMVSKTDGGIVRAQRKIETQRVVYQRMCKGLPKRRADTDPVDYRFYDTKIHRVDFNVVGEEAQGEQIKWSQHGFFKDLEQCIEWLKTDKEGPNWRNVHWNVLGRVVLLDQSVEVLHEWRHNDGGEEEEQAIFDWEMKHLQSADALG